MLVVLLLLLGMPLYSTLFAPLVEGQLRRAFGRPVALSGLRADLLGSTVRVKGLTIREEEGDAEAFVLDRAAVEFRLIPLLRGEIEVPQLTVDGFRLALAVDADGRLNWQPVLDRLKGGRAAAAKPSTPPPVRADIRLSRGEISYSNAAVGVHGTVSDLAARIQVDGMDRIGHEIAARAACGGTGPETLTADGDLSWEGSTSLATGAGGPDVAARGDLVLRNLRFEGLAGGPVADRQLGLAYEAELDPDRRQVAVPTCEASCEYFELAVGDLHLTDFGRTLAHIQRLAGVKGADVGTSGATELPPWRGTLKGTVFLDRLAADFGPHVARLTRGRLGALGGTLDLRVSLAEETAGALSLREELVLRDASAAGRGQGGPFRLGPAELTHVGRFTLSRAALSGRVGTEVHVPSADSAGGAILATATTVGSSLTGPTGGAPVRRLSNELFADLDALSSSLGSTAEAFGLVPAGVHLSGALSHHVELTDRDAGIRVAGGGQVADLAVSLPTGSAGESREFPLGAAEWSYNAAVDLVDGRISAVHLAGGSGARLTLGAPGVAWALTGDIRGMDHALPSWRLGNFGVRASAEAAPLVGWLEQLGLAAGGAAADGLAVVDLVAHGPIGELELRARVSYRGRIGGPAPATGEPVRAEIEAEIRPILRVSGLPDFLREPDRCALDVQCRPADDDARDVVMSSNGERLFEGRLSGGVSVMGGTLRPADPALRLIARAGQVRQALSRWMPEERLQIPESLSVGGTAVIDLLATESDAGEVALDVALDMTPTDFGFEGPGGQPLVAKKPGMPMTLDFTAGWDEGQNGGLVLHPVEFRFLGMSGRAGLAVEPDGSLAGPGGGGAFLQVPEFTLGSIGPALPLLAGGGLNEGRLAAVVRNVRLNSAEGAGSGELQASVNLPTLSLPELRAAVTALPASESPETGQQKEPELTQPEAVRAPAGVATPGPELAELLRGFSAHLDCRIGSFKLDETRRIANVHGAVLFNHGGPDGRLMISTVLEPLNGSASAGRLQLTCEGNLDAPPLDALDFTGRFVSGPLQGGRVSGWCDGIASGRPAVQARLNLPRVDIDDELISLLPESYQALLGPYSLDGTVSVAGFIARATDGRVQYSAEVDLSDGRLKCDRPPLTLHGLSAAVHVDEKRVQCRQFVGRAWGGDVNGTLLVTLQTPAGGGPTFECRIEMKDASLGQLGSQLSGQAARMAGRMSAGADVRGSPGDLHSIAGRGSFDLSEARLAELPLVAGLFDVFSLRLPERAVFDQIELAAQAENGMVNLSSILLSSQTVDITGKGRISFEGDCNLVMGVVTSQRPGGGIPLLSDALTFAVRGLQRNVLPPVRVTGKVWEPRYTPMVMEPIRRPLASVAGLIPLLPEPGTNEQTGSREASVRSFGLW